jgi:hypothetical protein
VSSGDFLFGLFICLVCDKNCIAWSGKVRLGISQGGLISRFCEIGLQDDGKSFAGKHDLVDILINARFLWHIQLRNREENLPSSQCRTCGSLQIHVLKQPPKNL